MNMVLTVNPKADLMTSERLDGRSHVAIPPSGCRPDNQPLFKTVTERRGGPRPGSGPKRHKPPSVSFRPGWYVAATLPKAERRAHASLHLAGYEPYLPLLTTRRPDRSWHTTALFQGYVFCRIGPAQPWYPIRLAPGVYSLLTTDGLPTPCPEAVILALQAGDALRSTPTTRDDLYRPGAPCEASLGGGQKVEAVVLSVNKAKATVIAIMFGALREMTVNIDNLRLRGE
jgi:Transcription termination factor nusG